MPELDLEIRIRQELAAVALGQAVADLAVVNGEVLNVYTGELRRADVLIKKGLIAAVGNSPTGSIGSATQIVEAKGKVLIPGLIDGHTHVDHYVFSELAPWALRGATTTIITETTGLPFPLGYAGLEVLLDSARDQPLRIYATVTPMTTANPQAAEHAITPVQVSKMLERQEVVGLGESYWNPLFGGDARVMACFEAARRSGKRIEGHTAGAKGQRLQSYVGFGVTSCHEPVSPEEVLERLRLGLFVFLREGETRQDLHLLAGIKGLIRDFQNIGLASDGLGPEYLINQGHMDSLVRQAIQLGFDPVTAIKMASYNVARYFRLDHVIGGISPGHAADIAVIPELSEVRAETVISGGQVVISGGKFVGQTRKHKFPDFVMDSLSCLPESKVADFKLTAEGGSRARVRVLEVTADAIKREAIIDLAIKDHEIQTDVTRDILKVAAIERTNNPGQIYNGFIRGFGLRRGAIATSGAGDCWVVLVIGVDTVDMSYAVNRLRGMRGGTVVVAGGSVIAELPMPIGSIMSEAPLTDIARGFEAIQRAYAALGGTLPEIRIPLTFLTSEAIPFFAVCERGLIDMKRQIIVPGQIKC